ncbi:hypothetical protein PsorP6_000328 [Peronosclerospora sorghi]|uniref:Uncharacterized protein n=1 Tax=Peronosclerospora sorghi TaxID=230839 RepID=A0ACC0WSK1_9STRA|nr:hypothetical protein PsorP6_000328 [Peronosclerospora sorghi]
MFLFPASEDNQSDDTLDMEDAHKGTRELMVQLIEHLIAGDVLETKGEGTEQVALHNTENPRGASEGALHEAMQIGPGFKFSKS